MTLSIRNYSPEDVDATIEIFLRAIREVASKDYDAEQVHAWAQVENSDSWAKGRASRLTWMASVNGDLAGFSDLMSNGYVDMMFVHPAYQNQGVASLLLSTVEAEARRVQIPAITTEASLTARHFFERRGFKVMAAQEVQKRGVTLKNFRMEKRIWKID